ncbi:Proto-oncogene FRAT1 [Pteropus alecto]|uniref:Proto-oncogene FRAT1 n=1 Tax=Pteropus alecto TaxID=9402 RepID=L5JPM8_PTEAL|nr:Proto-oncogene FRAT1 [Pteropus alecto]
MPCRREEEEEAGEEAEGEEEEEDSFFLLEQSVTLGSSGEVDRLVAQISETLQLDGAQDSPASPCAPSGPPLHALSPLPPQPGLDGAPEAFKRGAPQSLSGPCRRGWLRGAAGSRRLQQRRGPQPEVRTGDDDPHRLLQQLVLSGNLIKEAVRRLHSRRLQLHAKLPQRPLLRPPTAPVHKPPSPRSPRAACSNNSGATGRRAQLRTGDGVLVPGS